jgi:branched-chain amino acid transport system permease protein
MLWQKRVGAGNMNESSLHRVKASEIMVKVGPTYFRNSKTWLLFLVGALIFILPRFGVQYHSYLMLTFFAFAIALLGVNLLLGYAGLLSFGHALFFSIGAYTVAFLTTKLSIPYMEVHLLAAVAISIIVSGLIGFICVRYTKIYFGLLTFAFGMLFHTFLIKTYHFSGGDEGMRVVRPFLLGFDLSAVPKMQFLMGSYYYYAFVILIIAVVVMAKVVNSPFGLSLMAIRDNPEKATYLGIDVKRYRWYAFILSGAYAAVGGVLLAPVVGQVDPTMTYWTQSGQLIFMTLLGGFETFLGPLLGGIVYIYLQDSVMSLTEYWRIIFGGMLAFIVIVAPGGIASVIGLLWKKEKPSAEEERA